MQPDLRDLFAIQFAAALTREQRYSLEFIAGRAYDLAEAMLTERERRIDAETRTADAEHWAEPGMLDHEGLLDSPAPPLDADSATERFDREPSLDPRWLEPPYDPAWDAEKFRLEPTGEPASARPGLARTRLDEADDAKKRTA